MLFISEGYTLHAYGDTCRVERTGSGGRGLLGAAGRAPVGWTYSRRCSHVTEKSKRWVRLSYCAVLLKSLGINLFHHDFPLITKFNLSETRLNHRPCTTQLIPLIHPCKRLVKYLCFHYAERLGEIKHVQNMQMGFFSLN